MSFLTRVADKANGVHVTTTQVSGLLYVHEALREYLTSEKYPDGSSRERATLMVFCEGGVVKVCMTDRDQSRQMWRAGQSLEECIQQLEEALQSPVQDWRVQTYGGKKKRS